MILLGHGHGMIGMAETHTPFLAVAGVLVVVGYVLGHRVFTVDKATHGGRRRGAWHWARELLPLGIVAAGGLVGALWVDPIGIGWDRAHSVAYFALSGVVSLPAVSIARGRGYKITIPGDTLPP